MVRMNRMLRGVCAVTMMGLLALTTGCPSPRTSNQGGGTIVSTASKLAERNIGDLTPDEWQIATDNLPTLADLAGIDITGIEIPPITDEQAQAIVDFLIANNIHTIDDLLALDLNTVEIPEELQSLVDLFA